MVDNRRQASRSRDTRRPSTETSQPDPVRTTSSNSLAKSKSTPSPTFLTSFPSFSPPEVTRSKKKTSSPSASPGAEHETPRAMKRGFRNASTPIQSRKASADTQASPSAMNRTVQAAASLRKSIMDTITARSSAPESPHRIFSGLDGDAGDPLAGASEEHVQRIISSSGGPVATIKKYSSDLAETNQRVAAERNSKLKIVEENRQLRAQMEDKEDEMDDLRKQLATTKKLFARYVGKVEQNLSPAPQVQILESPAGPYAFEDTSGTILVSLSDDFVFPDGSSIASTEAESSQSIEAAITPVSRGKSIDTIRPKKQGLKPPKPAHRLASTVKTEVVEMKSPVDIVLLPPALRDGGTPSEVLVDRMGFYITPDRERRHQEAEFTKTEDISESSSINSNPKDDDESMISTNELLCDAPMTPAARLIFRSESSSRIFIDVDKATATLKRENSGFASPVTATHVSGGIGPAASTVATNSLQSLLNPPPVQNSKALSSLLIKLNQAYDLQQKRRTNAWANFYEQTRDLLQKHQPTDDPLDEHSIAGVTALCSASHVSPEIRVTFNQLIRRGVPVTFRREVWLERSGAANIRDAEHYASLLTASSTDDAVALKEIRVDVERTLSNNVFFREGVGKTRLRDLLTAFARQNPDIGYSQGLNIIAANLLLMVPAPEDGFALLEVLVKDILPSTYYARDGTISGAILERDGQVITTYVSELFPSLHKHLLASGAPLTMFTPGWFISGFAACVNGEALYRLWDLVFGFCDGRFVFCFALALLKLNRKGLMECRDAEALMSYLGGRMSSAAVSLDTLINETFRMGEKVTLGDIEKRRKAVTDGG
ncbi:TBC-domain-containing protein [Microthyrium microscopicum]|uniref:TBC-domain-containing protein n=1 Tax=Microthyrium microscopicum TaxID=703497 RepID=A0A6A6U5F8_9PEZI|nr:TBC-domain-containing protein [Microthyrium microscopicum]